MVTRSTFETSAGGTIHISGTASATLDGCGVSVPFWFLVMSTAGLGVALSREQTWSLGIGGLLVGMTVVANELSLVVAFDKSPKNWQLDEPAPLEDL